MVLIGTGAFLFAFLFLQEQLQWPGWAAGLSCLGICVFGIIAVLVWNNFHPPAFTIVVGDDQVEYRFRDAFHGREFARANGLDV
jgi:hypothetical protein